MSINDFRMDRRAFGRAVTGSAIGLCLGGMAAGGGAQAAETLGSSASGALARRVSGSVSRHWRDHFSTLKNDAILCDINDRVLHYWGEDGFYRVYPTSVPLSEEMTRRGETEIVFKRPAPEWSPTPSMIQRNPDLPRYVGPGPDNPLGIRAMNLSWQYYLIHGTNDIRKIGRQSSSGCIGLHNEHVVEIFDRARVGTQVVVM